ncbi:MAG: hypothetical protein N2545_06450 [Thermoflexales bacterium]|nr:hypothetical protein [Thermoflexales bacterium]
MKRLTFSLLIALSLVFTSGCGLINTLFGGGGSQPIVATQWDDVPLPEGAQRQNVDIPLPMRMMLDLLVRPALEQEGVDLRNFEFAIYIASQAPKDIVAFYSKDRMRAKGWDETDSIGCLASEEVGTEGAYCLFLRGEGEQQTALVILVSKREAGGSDLTFLRFKSALAPTSTATP